MPYRRRNTLTIKKVKEKKKVPPIKVNNNVSKSIELKNKLIKKVMIIKYGVQKLRII